MSFLKRLFQRQPTRSEAARLLIAKMREVQPEAAFAYDDAEGVIRTGNGLVSLGNFYADYLRGDAAERAHILQVFAHGMLPPRLPDDLATAGPYLLPALRHRAGLDAVRIASGVAEGSETLEGLLPFSEDLAVAVVYDSEHGMASMGESELTRWGLSIEQAHALAIDNLRQKAPATFREFVPGLQQSDYGDYYDAARLLLPEHLHQLGLGGNPVAMVPNRSCLLVASDRNAQALAAMVQVAAHVLREESRPLSAEMLRLVDGKWSAWQPAEAEIRQALRSLQLQRLAMDYAQQQDALELHARAKGLAVEVLPLQLVQLANGRLLTCCPLPALDAECWLPHADVVMIATEAAASRRSPKPTPKPVAWTDFEREAGQLLERLPHALPRYRLKGRLEAAMVGRMERVEG